MAVAAGAGNPERGTGQDEMGSFFTSVASTGSKSW